MQKREKHYLPFTLTRLALISQNPGWLEYRDTTSKRQQEVNLKAKGALQAGRKK